MPKKISHKQKSKKHSGRRTKKYTRKQKGGSLSSGSLSRKGRSDLFSSTSKSMKLKKAKSREQASTPNTVSSANSANSENNGRNEPLPPIPTGREPVGAVNLQNPEFYMPMTSAPAPAPALALAPAVYENSSQFNKVDKKVRLRELNEKLDKLMSEWSIIRPEYLKISNSINRGVKISEYYKNNITKRDMLKTKLENIEVQKIPIITEIETLEQEISSN